MFFLSNGGGWPQSVWRTPARHPATGALQSRRRMSGVEWSGVEWSGVEWSGVEWSGEERRGEERREEW